MNFESVSIILPTLKETDSFIKAVSTILDMNDAEDIHEFIAVVCDRTNPDSFESIEVARKMSEAKGIPLSILYQTLPYFGGAIRDGFMAATGSHVCMVTPDLDTAPEKLPEMISLAKQYPGDVIIASRWRKGGGFENYNPVKKVWNWFSQKFLDVMFFTNVSDFTWGSQIMPTKLCQTINFQEVKHPINIERVAIPIRLGVKFHEVAGLCHMSDFKTVNPFLANLAYLRPSFRCRFAKRSTLLRNGANYEKLMQYLKQS